MQHHSGESLLFEPATTIAPGTRLRVDAIDVLRGVVMILMALDHVRDFFGMAGNPTDVAHASVPLFFTRWITHECAPVFFLLTGVGAYLARRRRSTPELSRYLLVRGVWLIALELTVVRCLGYQFNFDYRVTMLIILWALGWSMITLAALVYLPVSAVTAIGLAIVLSHNALDSVSPSSAGMLAPVWAVLHVPGVIVSGPRYILFVAYPLIPWVGVTAAGYGLGQIFEWPRHRRRDFLLRVGVGLIAAFVVLRGVNVYGDPAVWAPQATPIRTVLSFLNSAKYPPSLLYLLMTLGPALLFLRWADREPPRWLRPADVFGKVPFFYFLLHLPLIHAAAVVVCWARYGAVHWMFESARLDQFPFTRPPGWGYSLPIVYLVWFGVVAALYLPCRWFSALKQRRSDWWLSYV